MTGISNVFVTVCALQVAAVAQWYKPRLMRDPSEVDPRQIHTVV